MEKIFQFYVTPHKLIPFVNLQNSIQDSRILKVLVPELQINLMRHLHKPYEILRVKEEIKIGGEKYDKCRGTEK